MAIELFGIFLVGCNQIQRERIDESNGIVGVEIKRKSKCCCFFIENLKFEGLVWKNIPQSVVWFDFLLNFADQLSTYHRSLSTLLDLDEEESILIQMQFVCEVYHSRCDDEGKRGEVEFQLAMSASPHDLVAVSKCIFLYILSWDVLWR